MEAMPRRLHIWLLLMMSLVGMLAGCGQMRPIGERSDLVIYTVKPGDTLYSISWRYGYDHREIAAWNNIPPPYTIYVGQELLIIPPFQATPKDPSTQPGAAGTTTAANPPSSSPAVTQAAVIHRAPRPSPVKSPSNSTGSQTSTVEKHDPVPSSVNIHWRWPTNGTLRNTFGPDAGRKGLDIAGTLGQPVLAAAPGKVVYSGNGLIGYGNLVIIKHDARYLSAYGHNRRLLVKEGSVVKQGEKIAEMGDSGKEGVVLHFEIRRDGKPVDPLQYLPKQGP